MDRMQTTAAVAAVCGPFVLTVVAIGLATTTLARRSRRDEAAEDSGEAAEDSSEAAKDSAGSEAVAALVASLLHVVPISLAQATDYASDVIVASSLLASGDAQQAALGWIAVGALGLSLVFAWVSLLGFACGGTWTSYGNDHSLEPHQLLTAAVLAPFNLHVLYLGVVYSCAIAGADRGRSYSPKEASAGWYYMFVTLKLLETSVESVPLAVVVVAAIVAGGGTGSVLLWASLSITCLSMSYGLFMQAMDNASADMEGNTRECHQGKRLEIFFVRARPPRVDRRSGWLRDGRDGARRGPVDGARGHAAARADPNGPCVGRRGGQIWCFRWPADAQPARQHLRRQRARSAHPARRGAYYCRGCKAGKVS